MESSIKQILAIVSIFLLFLSCVEDKSEQIQDPIGVPENVESSRSNNENVREAIQEKGAFQENDSDCPDCGRQIPAQIRIDLTGVKGIITMSSDIGQGDDVSIDKALTAGNILGIREKTALPGAANSMFKSVESENTESSLTIDEDSELVPIISDALSDLPPEILENMPPPPPMPPVQAIALSPCGDVYVLFDWPFMYDPNCTDDIDPWSPDSECTCNFFKADTNLEDLIDDSSLDDLADSITADPDNLDYNDLTHSLWETLQTENFSNVSCVDNTHVVHGSDSRGLGVQFDGECNAYYIANNWNHWKNVVYKYTPEIDGISDASHEEIINANINFHNYRVTEGGGVFYSGETSTDGSGGGSGYFRYITEENASGETKLVEIIRNWWDVKAATLKGDRCNELTNTDEGVLYYGPDSETSSDPSWDTACLYCFGPHIEDDPSTEGDDRSLPAANCMNNFWNRINNPDYTPQQRYSLCKASETLTSEDGDIDFDALEALGDDYKKGFLGGGNIDAIVQNSDGSALYTIGETRVWASGTFKCDIQINTAHCSDLNPNTSQEECNNNGDEWRDWNNWESGQNEDICLTVMDHIGNVETSGEDEWHIPWAWCEAPYTTGDSWAKQYKSLSYIDVDKSVTVVSDVSEEAILADIVSIQPNVDEDPIDRLFYLSYSTGLYSFKEVNMSTNATTNVIDGIEIYNFAPNPLAANSLFYDGLKFETNEYVFGTIDIGEENYGKFTDTKGLTGTVQTYIIFPKFFE